MSTKVRRVTAEQEIARLTGVLFAIQAQLDGVEWQAETLDNIADILRNAGFEVRDTN